MHSSAESRLRRQREPAPNYSSSPALPAIAAGGCALVQHEQRLTVPTSAVGTRSRFRRRARKFRRILERFLYISYVIRSNTVR